MEELKQLPLVKEAIERAEQFDKKQLEDQEKSKFGFANQSTADMTLTGKKYTQMEMDYLQSKFMESQKEMDPFSNLARKGALNENLRAQQKLDEDNAKVKTAKYHDLYNEFQFMLNPDDSDMEDEEMVDGNGENLK